LNFDKHKISNLLGDAKHSIIAALQRFILYNVWEDTHTEKIAMRTIHVEFSDERLITPSGLVFVGQILGKSDFVKRINRAPII